MSDGAYKGCLEGHNLFYYIKVIQMFNPAPSPADEGDKVISAAVNLIQAVAQGRRRREVHPVFRKVHGGLRSVFPGIEVCHGDGTLGKDQGNLRTLPSHEDVLQHGIDILESLLGLGRTQFRPFHVLLGDGLLLERLYTRHLEAELDVATVSRTPENGSSQRHKTPVIEFITKVLGNGH